jgi:hypothetical protein
MMDLLIYLVICSFSDITGIHSSVLDPGTGTGFDPDSIRSVDPYTDPDKESGSRSRRAKITHKVEKI